MIYKNSLSIDYIDKRTDHKFHLPIAVFKKPATDAEYAKLEKILDQLIDVVRNNSKHPLSVAMQIIAENLEQYDDENHPPIGADVSDIDMVKHLMKQNSLTQTDMANIFGSQANVSKFLNGQRPLSMNQIIKLKNQFGLSADFFIKDH